MKKSIKTIILGISIFSLMHISINAQNEIDALRFSEIDWQGSARFMGAGKAFGAVGAEFSALNINPASIGLYKKCEVTFTPMTLSVYKNTSKYNESSALAQAIKYNVGSAGVVFAIPGISSTLWKKFQIGFGFNRIKNYNNMFSIDGRSNGNTIGSVFALAAEGLNYKTAFDAWSSELYTAWDSFLIDTLPGSETSYIPVFKGKDLHHTATVTRSGGNDEMIFSFGTNYDDKLFMGATVGVPVINFTENRVFMEENDQYKDHEFIYYRMTDKLRVRATGINLKLGIIYQPFNFLRIGVAFHTPTYYNKVKDDFVRKIDYNHGYGEEYKNSFEYTLTTPLRATGNLAFFIKQRAFISAEYEFAHYGMALMYSNKYNFGEENRAIQEMFGFSHIARIGAEINLTQTFSLRAGYNYVSSPYKDDINDGSQHYASAGFGFRTKHFFGDFAYTFNISKENYWMYDRSFVNTTHNKFLTHRILLTTGVRF